MYVWDLAAETPLEREIETEDFGLISNCAQALQMAIVRRMKSTMAIQEAQEYQQQKLAQRKGLGSSAREESAQTRKRAELDHPLDLRKASFDVAAIHLHVTEEMKWGKDFAQGFNRAGLQEEMRERAGERNPGIVNEYIASFGLHDEAGCFLPDPTSRRRARRGDCGEDDCNGLTDPIIGSQADRSSF